MPFSINKPSITAASLGNAGTKRNRTTADPACGHAGKSGHQNPYRRSRELVVLARKNARPPRQANLHGLPLGSERHDQRLSMKISQVAENFRPLETSCPAYGINLLLSKQLSCVGEARSNVLFGKVGVAFQTCSSRHPAARSSTTNSTDMRLPRIVGLPIRTCGSITIRSRQFMKALQVSPPYLFCPTLPDLQSVSFI